jgi:HSP20 family protein
MTTNQTQTSPTPTTPNPKTQVYPFVDVFEGENEFLLVADLPGVNKSDLELRVERGELRLRAQTEDLDYRRSFPIGDDVDLEAIDAKLDLGQLEIRLPKLAATRTRKIEVK